MRAAAPVLVGFGGVLLGAGVSVAYALGAYRSAMPYMLGVAIIAVAVSLRQPSTTDLPSIRPRKDVLAVAALLLIMVPLYTLSVYTTPWQVSTDEITLISVSRMMMTGSPADIFGITGYFGCPAAAFLLFGILGQILGGIDLYHLRLAHAILGVACIVAAYELFRQFMRPIVAFSSAVILGANHSLVGYSRMALWPNSSLFLELLALLLLVHGIQQKSLRSLFLSGVACGLTFYFYFPGRITIVICVLVLIATWLIGREQGSFRSLTKSVAVLSLGCALVAPPVLIATAKNPKLGFQYQREQLLIYPEGRKAAEYWTHTTSPRDAWIANIKNGLGTFNARVVDHGWLYPNPGHGFVDPITGALVWVGFIGASFRIVRHRRKRSREPGEGDARVAGDLVAIIGFTTLFLMLAFVVTKAPNYQRLLLILPFVAYLAGDAVWSILDGISARVRGAGRFKAGRVFPLVGTGITAVILGLNIDAFHDFASAGRAQGHEVGSTGRFVEARKHEAGHTWVLAADKDNLYYFWGEPWWWRGWLGFFAGPDQSVKVVPVPTIAGLATLGKTTVFISRSSWEKQEREFRSRHTVESVTNIVPSGRLIAVEVEGPR